MKRMVLGLLLFSLISFSPVFAGKTSDDGSFSKGAETEGVTGGLDQKKKLTANDEMIEDIDKNVDKKPIFQDGTETPAQE